MANCYCSSSSVDLCDHCTETWSTGWDSGKAQERERILTLLEDYLTDKLHNDDGEVEPSQPYEWDGLEKAIKLIKGEGK
jgi:hypothetical protein